RAWQTRPGRSAGHRAQRAHTVHHAATATGSAMNARVPPGTIADVGIMTRIVAAVSGLATGTRPPGLFLVLGKHRRLFHGWLRFAGRLLLSGELPRREAELVILRVAVLRNCDYEFEQHRRLAGRVGVRPADISRVRTGSDAHGWSDRERILLSATETLHTRWDL